MSYIRFENIVKSFGSNTVLKDINLEVEKGQLVTLLGPSGCGKSTLLRCLSGLETVTSGKVYLDDRDITDVNPKDRDIGMVFQQYSLFPNMDVAQNVAFGLKMKKVPNAEIDKRVKEMVDIVGLSDHLHHYPSELSGGQQQRAALARAMVTNPKVLLLDEPLSAIDAILRHSLQVEIRRIQQELNMTAIFVTHDQDEAIEVADEIIITNRGRIEQKGSPLEVYQNPDTAFTAGFFGQTSVIDDYQVFNHFEEVPGGEKAIVRPEFVKVTKKNEEQKYKSSATEGVVERVAFRGSSLELKVRVGDTVLSARRSLDEEPVREGEVVDVFVQRIFVTKGNEAVLLHNTAMVEDWLVI